LGLAEIRFEGSSEVTTNPTEEITMNANVKTTNRIPRILSTALILICSCASSGAFADEQVRSERVKFHDLNVNTPEGVQALYGRIHKAAFRVCDGSDPIQRQAVVSCAGKAEADAIQKLNLPQLTAYYKIKAKGGDQAQPLVANR
jgi:UrcA family protein